jgi:hypothetical protein
VKLTKEQLKQIIKEELEELKTLQEDSDEFDLRSHINQRQGGKPRRPMPPSDEPYVPDSTVEDRLAKIEKALAAMGIKITSAVNET